MKTRKILVVDDEQGILDLFKKVLDKEGYAVITALNGQEALKAVKEENPDLIILDIKMPGMDGIETLGGIKKIDKKAMVLMLTAYGTLDSAKEALKLGAHDYITKPFKLDYIKEVIKESIFHI
jgi:DNA-binding NtrC family response regulator